MCSVSPKKLFSSLGNAHEFELALIKSGVKPTSIQDVIDGKLLVSFVSVVGIAKALDFKQLCAWLRKNKLESKLSGGLEGQIADQEKFYQKLYGENFRINRKKILVGASRLPAVKAGLETGCINYAMLKATPDFLSEAEAQMTGAEFFFERLMKPLKKDGFKIWAETGTDQWTKLTLTELLQRCNPTEPEDFDIEAFKRGWVAEEKNVIGKKDPTPKVSAGTVEIIFTSNLVDIPRDQKIVSSEGSIVELDDRSYVSAIAKKVRILSHEEGIILESQLYVRNKTYLTPNTWEWRRDVVDHRDKGTNPSVSVARACFRGSEFGLDSTSAGFSSSSNRLRLAL